MAGSRNWCRRDATEPWCLAHGSPMHLKARRCETSRVLVENGFRGKIEIRIGIYDDCRFGVFRTCGRWNQGDYRSLWLGPLCIEWGYFPKA